jgi:hypothetical protein
LDVLSRSIITMLNKEDITKKKNQVLELDSSYNKIIQSIKSENTKTSYYMGLKYFMKFMNVDRCLNY